MTPRSSNNDFRCIHCGNYVSALQVVSGVHNRNHCPYCLWSRHLDLFTAGDRLSACKAPMRPIGLSMKPAHNKYAVTAGELVLVHSCVDCGRISINRIASDDDADSLNDIFMASFNLAPATHTMLMGSGIRLLDEADSGLVRQLVPQAGALVSA